MKTSKNDTQPPLIQTVISYNAQRPGHICSLENVSY